MSSDGDQNGRDDSDIQHSSLQFGGWKHKLVQRHLIGQVQSVVESTIMEQDAAAAAAITATVATAATADPAAAAAILVRWG